MKKIISVILMLALLISISGAEKVTALNSQATDCSEWITAMGNFERSSASNCMLNPLDENFREIWRTKVGYTVIGSQPVIYKDKLGIGTIPIFYDDEEDELVFANKDTHGFVCLDADNGEFNWMNPLTGWGATATASIDRGSNNFIIGSISDPDSNNPEDWMEQKIFSIDMDSGVTEWSYSTPYGVSASGVINGAQYFVGTNDRSRFICLNANNGVLDWSVDSPNNHGGSSPCLLNNKLYTYCYNGNFSAISSDGVLKWREKLGNSRVRNITPAVWDGNIVVPSTDGSVFLYDEDGNEIWKCQFAALDNNDTVSSPAIWNDYIYIYTQELDKAERGFYYGDSVLFQIDAKKGKVKKSVPLESSGGNLGPPSIVNGLLFLNDGYNSVNILSASNLDAITSIGIEGYPDEENEVIWSGNKTTSISIYEDKLYVGLITGEVVCFGISPYTPLLLDYGDCYLGTENEETLEINNIYDVAMDYHVSANASWIGKIENRTGTLLPGETTTVSLTTVPEKLDQVNKKYRGTITVKLGEEQTKIPVILNTIFPDKIYISPNPAKCEFGTEIEFTARPMGADGERLSGYKFRWEVSNSTVGEINSETGIFYGKKIGTSDVRAFAQPEPEEGIRPYGSSEVEVIELLEPIVPTLLNFGTVNLTEENKIELVIKNRSAKPISLKFIPYENWFKLADKTLEIAGEEEGVTTIELVNSRFKAGEKKIGDIKVSWSGNSQRVTVVAKAGKDSKPPTITLDDFETNVTDKKTVTISGSTDEKCEIFINGNSVAHNTTDFEYTLELKNAPSKNPVIITATDTYGNSSTKDIEIINNYMLTIVTGIGNKILKTNGVPVHLDVPPTIVSGRTLAPFRAIAEAFGAEVDWIAETKTVVMTLGDIVLELPIGKAAAKISGKEIMIDPPAQIVSGRTMVPLRFVGEAFGAEVGWEGSTKTITITKLITP